MARRGTAFLFYFTFITLFKLKPTYLTSLWVTEMREKYNKNIATFARVCGYFKEGADPVSQLRIQELHFEKMSQSADAITLLTCMRTVLSSIPGRTADYTVRFPRLTSVTSRSTPDSTVNYTIQQTHLPTFFPKHSSRSAHRTI
jgi:hypothetical protein